MPIKSYQPFFQLLPFKAILEKFLFFTWILLHKESHLTTSVMCKNPIQYIQPH